MANKIKVVRGDQRDAEIALPPLSEDAEHHIIFENGTRILFALFVMRRHDGSTQVEVFGPDDAEPRSTTLIQG